VNEPLLVWDRHLMPYVFDRVEDLYARAGITPKRIPTPEAGPHNQAGLMMVASGKGIYLCMGVPLSTNNGVTSVTVVPLSDPEATLDVCVAWRKDESSPVVRQFLESVWQVFPHARGGQVAKSPARRTA
jgi:DNA-binding transcriptional LysR family regulator